MIGYDHGHTHYLIHRESAIFAGNLLYWPCCTIHITFTCAALNEAKHTTTPLSPTAKAPFSSADDWRGCWSSLYTSAVPHDIGKPPPFVHVLDHGQPSGGLALALGGPAFLLTAPRIKTPQA